MVFVAAAGDTDYAAPSVYGESCSLFNWCFFK